MDDQSLIELIRHQQTDRALGELYRHFPMMRKMVQSLGGSPQDAEDIFQEALIILVKKLRNNDFTLTSKLSTYLYGVCRLLWKDSLRRRKGMAVPIIEDFGSGLAEEDEHQVDQAMEQENRARLAERALASLKDRCRELLLLFYDGRLKLKEIAIKMGYQGENAAKNQKYKCLESARDRLKELKQTVHIS
ncbi:MAG: sigma-70 family RNA polymerase sigma factor [Bacteroidota bacterium]|nr:sigma-70 family RNA polymerase sigma factor [Bacteroidota bacterium]MDP4215050.1 sigma-70 family RNA polymerase sigma factor [Bacteroidota bacterium]MDP4244281.1 sigma-70 family RNA polymerase sigma factor [Bacteroidota bacterium]MDP4252789.1 sigma-70 family RNA polymerase sigma factor [Bacteroidota bacterium]MDP4257526.1 sigma-70 family RNA polymerase sigma factor [Bacteroidota bacterium]